MRPDVAEFSRRVPRRSEHPWTADATEVTQYIVRELQATGLDATVAERLGGEPFSVGMQRKASFRSRRQHLSLCVPFRRARCRRSGADHTGWHGRPRRRRAPRHRGVPREAVLLLPRPSHCEAQRVRRRSEGRHGGAIWAGDHRDASPLPVTILSGSEARRPRGAGRRTPPAR